VARYSGREYWRTDSAQELRSRRSRRWRIATRAGAPGRAKTVHGRGPTIYGNRALAGGQADAMNAGSHRRRRRHSPQRLRLPAT
jgi:hypothetical protein